MRRRFVVRCTAVVVFSCIAAPRGLDPGGRDPVRRTAETDVPSTIAPPRPAGGSTPEPEPPTETESFACEEGTVTATRTEGTAESFDQLRHALAPLSASTDPEHLLTLALLRSKEDVAGSLELMARALAYDPGNPLILVNLGEACLDNPGAATCAGRDVRGDLLRAAGDNGAIWARIAAWRHQRGDRAGALDALQRATVAPGYDDYWIDHTLLFERALAASTDYTYTQRIETAIVLGAAVVGREIDAVQICVKEAAESPAWRRTCADFGRRMEADAATLIGVAVGLELQIRAHEAAGEKAALALVNRRREELQTLLPSSLPRGAYSMLFRDETFVSEYVTEFAAHGELAAMRYMKEAVEHMKPLPDSVRCRD